MRKQEQPSKGLLGGFRRYAPPNTNTNTKKATVQPSEEMGTAFSRGDSAHLPPMRMGNNAFITETQADQLQPEMIIEQMDHDEGCWACDDPEAGGVVKVDAPEHGRMVRVKVTGQAVVYLDATGKLVVDNRGY